MQSAPPVDVLQIYYILNNMFRFFLYSDLPLLNALGALRTLPNTSSPHTLPVSIPSLLPSSFFPRSIWRGVPEIFLAIYHCGSLVMSLN